MVICFLSGVLFMRRWVDLKDIGFTMTSGRSGRSRLVVGEGIEMLCDEREEQAGLLRCKVWEIETAMCFKTSLNPRLHMIIHMKNAQRPNLTTTRTLEIELLDLRVG